MNRVIKKLVSTLLVMMFLVEGYMTLSYWIGLRVARKDYEALSRQYNVQDAKSRPVNPLAQLMTKYKEMVGWLKVPELEIDYPIMQAVNNSYYLSHNYKGEESSAGSIFMDAQNTPDFTDEHTVLYGHNMRDETMFGKLKVYKEKETLGEAPHIIIARKDETIYYEIFAIYEADANETYRQLHFESRAQFKAFWEQAKARSLVKTQCEFKEDASLMTLSTCSSESAEKRLVVVAQQQ